MLELRANTGTVASGHKVVGKSCRLEIKRLLTTRRNIQFKRGRQSYGRQEGFLKGTELVSPTSWQRTGQLSAGMGLPPHPSATRHVPDQSGGKHFS